MNLKNIKNKKIIGKSWEKINPISDMRDLLLHVNLKNVKPNSVPAFVKNTLVAYSFGNTTLNKIPKSRIITQGITHLTMSEIIRTMNAYMSLNSNTNLTLYSKQDITTIPFNHNNYINVNPTPPYILSLLRKEYSIQLSLGDRMNINYTLESFFLSFNCLISTPHYFITPDKVKISFNYYSIYNQKIEVKNYNQSQTRMYYIHQRKYSLKYRGINTSLFNQIKYKKNIRSYIINNRRIKRFIKFQWLRKNNNLFNIKQNQFIKYILKHTLKPQKTKELNKNEMQKMFKHLKHQPDFTQSNHLNILGNPKLPIPNWISSKINFKWNPRVKELKNAYNWYNLLKEKNELKKENNHVLLKIIEKNLQSNTFTNNIYDVTDPNNNSNPHDNYYLKHQIQKIQLLLSKIFNTNIELDINETHYSYHNSDILSKRITFFNKKAKFMRIARNIFNRASLERSQFFLKNSQNNALRFGLPYQLTGLRLKLSGRWVKERTKPKRTVQLLEFGSFAITNSNYTRQHMALTKNKKGSFNIKAWTGTKTTNYIPHDILILFKIFQNSNSILNTTNNTSYQPNLNIQNLNENRFNKISKKIHKINSLWTNTK